MAFALPDLPYATDALAPHINQETLELHHGKHHAGYIAKLNEAIAGTLLERKSLEQLVRGEHGAVFESAAQAWNHAFYWQCMSPDGGGRPNGKVAAALEVSFGNFERFRGLFTTAANGHFGSGWVWLVKGRDDRLSVVTTHDAGCPITTGATPVLACDVWEHAYYLDYKNERAKYIEAWWNVVDWDFAMANLG